VRAVLDASAALHLVLGSEQAGELAAALEACDLVIAPDLFHGEVANALWKYVRAGHLDVEGALACYEEAIALVDEFERDGHLATEALVAAARHDHPVYDCLYLVLARRHGCRLLTKDSRLLALAGRIAPESVPPPVRARGRGRRPTSR
jgi:predicted nucleic acid-binding protein